MVRICISNRSPSDPQTSLEVVKLGSIRIGKTPNNT